MIGGSKNKIWIDLENSPHVPFFRPIMRELSKKGYPIFITARDYAQTCELANKSGFPYVRIGSHFGKNKVFKVIGLLVRVLQLMPVVLREKPTLSIAHGSRSQVVLARLLGIPSVTITDYEYANHLIRPTWVILPEVIPAKSFNFDQSRIFHYPGIKEEVYVSTFSPDPSILEELGINVKNLNITIRPPANEAHYFNPQSEVMFNAVIDHFGVMDGVRMILLPRDRKQADSIRSKWSELISKGRIILPNHVIDGLNLIWHSDFVISGGGTMNREAAALGVPVYSIFRGKTGAVDRHLAKTGKLILLESVEDIEKKISSVKRVPAPERLMRENKTVHSIVGTIISLMHGERKER